MIRSFPLGIMLSVIIAFLNRSATAFVIPTTTISATSRMTSIRQVPHSPMLLRKALLEDLTGKLNVDITSDVSAAAAASSTLSRLDPIVLMGGGIAVLALSLVVIFVSVFTNKKDGDSSTTTKSSTTKTAASKIQEPEPIDVSIPYNAAALLAYQKVNANGKETDEEFDDFNQLYKKVCVAEVTLKQSQQKVAALKEEFANKYPAATTFTNTAAAAAAAAAVNGTMEEIASLVK